MIKELKTIEKIDENTQIKYWRLKMPMMSDRDNVVEMITKDMGDGNTYVQCKSIERDDVPELPGVVRCFLFVRAFIRDSKEVENALDFTEITCFNMKGYFPGRLLNMIIASETQREFGNMYKYLKEKN